MWFISEKIQELKKLENSLKRFSNITLPEGKKSELKQNILAYTKTHVPAEEFSFALLIKKLHEFAQNLFVSDYFRVLLKEKLITLVEFKPRKEFQIWKSKKIFATVLLGVFLVTVFFQFTFNIEKVEASYVTVLEEAKGDVTIVRGSQEIKGAPQLFLKTNDVIRTGKNSKAVIRFLDQSVSRLDENTEVKISNLFINPSNKTETFVELVLHKGRLWSRVVNLIDKFSRFQVKAGNTVTVAKKKAAFDVSMLSKGKTKVTAVKNKVDIAVATNKKIIETTLVNGFTAEVKSNGASAPPKIKSGDSVSQAKDEWVSGNLANDVSYIQELKEQNQQKMEERAKVLPGDPLYAVKKISAATEIAFTFNDLEKRGKVLIVAQGKLAEAQIFLGKGDKEAAASALQEFQKQINGIFEWINAHENANQIEAVELRMQLKAMLDEYQKQLAVVLPTDPMYSIKEVVGRMKILVAPEAEKSQEKLDQASEKLFEAHDLAAEGNTVAAVTQVELYKNTFSEVVSDVHQLSGDVKEKAVASMIETKIEDLKTLETIAMPLAADVGTGTAVAPFASQGTSTAADVLGLAPPVLDLSGSSTEAQIGQLLKTVDEAKTETFEKLDEAVLDAQNTDTPRVEMMQQLSDLKQIDINGKPLVRSVNLSKAVIDSAKLPTAGLETPKLPQ